MSGIDIDKITKISIILAMILISTTIIYIFVFLPIRAQIESRYKKYCDECLQAALEKNYREYEQACGAMERLKGEKFNPEYLECEDENKDKFLNDPCAKKCIKGENLVEAVVNRSHMHSDYFIKKLKERKVGLELLRKLYILEEKLKNDNE